jgi:hypothetical protein
VELEDLKIKTRLTNEKFASVKGECAIGTEDESLNFFVFLDVFFNLLPEQSPKWEARNKGIRDMTAGGQERDR